MLQLQLTQLPHYVALFTLVFFRILAMLAAMPMLNNIAAAKRSKILLSLLLALIILPFLKINPQIPLFSWQFLQLIFCQLLIGLSAGFVLQIVFQIFVFAGELIATQAGLGFATLIDPQNGTSVPILSQFYSIAVLLLFLSLNGHLWIIHWLLQSFKYWSPWQTVLTQSHWYDLVSLTKILFLNGVLIALPAIISLLLVNIAFAVMTRALPQLNVYSIAFPITLVTAFVIMFLTLPTVLSLASQLLQQGFGVLDGWFIK